MLILEIVRRVKQNHSWCKSILSGSLMLLLAVQSAFANLSVTTSPKQVKLGHVIEMTDFTYIPSVNPSAGIVSGPKEGQYAPPYAPDAGAPMLGDYLYVAAFPAPAATAVLSFLNPRTTQFSLLWGSVDKYNTLLFSGQFGTGGTTATVTGDMVETDADGNQGPTGSRWVLITAPTGQWFDSVEITSSQNSFEGAFFTSTPEPGFYGVLALGLSGLWFAVGRRRRA